MINITLENIHIPIVLIQEAILDLKIENRSSVSYILNNIANHIKYKNGGLLVDNLTNPDYLVWFAINQSALLNQKMLQIPLIYVRKSKRGNSYIIKTMHSFIEKTKSEFGCDIITGASWRIGDTESQSKQMWEKQGYSVMETVFEK